jgi:hypothetical protein
MKNVSTRQEGRLQDPPRKLERPRMTMRPALSWLPARSLAGTMLIPSPWDQECVLTSSPGVIQKVD